ncbi:hypothetical protein ACRE_027530 [Hapsidospora chrysogenum ATCC 11550]|uniref:SET domain-containing protein n=1 Tax=Hapsidospora chrysogenum (strain ATCC 11550 / CBS 779.69 / DSM 880 / IAM 14645 / JCM 23072 / IMI 49137) TaxID=857340 RepID=A0A086TAU5_HAPC1|nr:hypothetical protein ACRE_027530 [Hapsidospora chrysogenum ATCC 11550]
MARYQAKKAEPVEATSIFAPRLRPAKSPMQRNRPRETLRLPDCPPTDTRASIPKRILPTVAGLGALATQQLRRGDVILVEEPLFTSDNTFEKLDRDARRVALSLHKNERLKSDTPALSAVWYTNSFATNMRPGHAGLFAVAARFNHACHPAHNVDFAFDPAQGCLVLTSSTICYGETWTPDVLFLWYGFCCSCGACAGLSTEEMSALTPQW